MLTMQIVIKLAVGLDSHNKPLPFSGMIITWGQAEIISRGDCDSISLPSCLAY